MFTKLASRSLSGQPATRNNGMMSTYRQVGVTLKREGGSTDGTDVGCDGTWACKIELLHGSKVAANKKPQPEG